MTATMAPPHAATATETPAVHLVDISRRYDGNVVLNGVDLTVAPGEFVSLVGPSGCGKTTLLRIIAGFEQPDAGSVEIFGRSMNGVPAYLRNTAIVVQNFALFRNMTVQQNVEFGLEMRNLSRQDRARKATEMLEVVGLTGLGGRRVDQLSGGQRQRVALARALVVQPDVLLLDEPLGALDANLRVRMQSELKGLQRSLGITFVHVTGNQAEAMAMADRMVVIGHGRVIQQGKPHQVFRQPQTRFVARFMGNNNLISGRLGAVDAATGRGTIETALGTFDLFAQGAAPGAEGALCIRTDRLRFAMPDDSGDHITGTLIGEEFAGATMTYLVQAGEEVVRMERHLSVQELSRHVAGETVSLTWAPDDARFVPADDQPATAGAGAGATR
jgi:ABC-type Fe3+/spermidine/putrescine transport system ATPase subunit